jgi:DNA-binding transcriptional ArsR family regulator
VAEAALDRTLAALADPTRRRVVELLRRQPRRAGELADAFGVSAPAMSRHLRVLRTRGLVEESREDGDARCRVYRLRPEPFRDLASWLAEVEAFWSDQLGAFKRHAERAQRKAKGAAKRTRTAGFAQRAEGERRPPGQAKSSEAWAPAKAGRR